MPSFAPLSTKSPPPRLSMVGRRERKGPRVNSERSAQDRAEGALTYLEHANRKREVKAVRVETSSATVRRTAMRTSGASGM